MAAAAREVVVSVRPPFWLLESLPCRLSPAQVIDALEDGNFDALVGTPEHDEVECKSAPYRFADESQRIELAKDIAGLANANGGVLLIGFRTEREQTTREDVIRQVSSFPRNLLDVEQYQACLASTIYPPLTDVRFRWFDHGSDGRGLIVVVVPPQPSKPYLLARTLNEQGRRVEVLAGYFERRRAGVAHMSVQRLQTLLRDGLRFDALLTDRLDSIEQRLAARTPEPPENAVNMPAASARARVEEVIAAAQFPEGPVYALAAYPDVPVALRGFVEQRDSELARLVADPPRLRANGFDLGADRDVRLLRGELLRSRLPGWKAIDVWRDGFLAFAAAGNEDFLCWAREGLAINPLVLAESCYLFAEFARVVHGLAEPIPGHIEYRLELHKAQSEAGALALAPRSGFLRATQPPVAPAVNRPGYVGGPIPREDGPDGTTQQVFPRAA